MFRHVQWYAANEAFVFSGRRWFFSGVGVAEGFTGKEPKGLRQVRGRIRRLAEMGHELRRPEADFLRDGIYELRAKLGMVNYRILYFFHDRDATVLAHAITKENEIPVVDINRALERKRMFVANPAAHTFIGDIEDA